MSALEKLLNQPRSRKAAVAIALLGTVTPLVGLHKFYLKQPLWGVIYFLLGATPVPRFACAIEAVWLMIQDQEQFEQRFNGQPEPPASTVDPERVGAVVEALRQLDQLRSDGLMSEYEFEQKRRQLLDQIA
ncbi:MAG: SHOCT domain-containing protein [Cyanophyceae cyanobacterium]